MFCEYCGVQMEPKSTSCVHCGAKVKKQTVDRELAEKKALQKAAPTPVFMQRGQMVERNANIRPIYYAGFWQRVAARVIDMIIVSIGTFFFGIFNLIASFFIGEMFFFSFFFISWLYYAMLDSSSLQGTIGKRLVGLKVCDLEGKRISFLRASARYACQWLSYATMYIGFFMVAFTDRKQTLHDMITSCIVVEKRS